MKKYIFATMHVIGLLLLTSGMSLVTSPDLSSLVFDNKQTASFILPLIPAVGIWFLYWGLTVCLKEEWKNKDLTKMKIMGF